MPGSRPDAILIKRAVDNSNCSGKAGDGEALSRAFSRDARLLRPADFSRVFAGAVRSGDRYFTVLGRRADRPEGGSRLGLAIAKKQLRRAVDRNRVKRLIREYFRTRVLPETAPAMDFVVLARRAVLHAGNRELRRALERLFREVREQVVNREKRG